MRVFSIHEPDDARLDPYRNLPGYPRERDSGLILAEGLFVVQRLLASEYPVDSILVTEKRFEELRADWSTIEADILVVPRAILQEIVGFKLHGGILACGRRRPPADLATTLGSPPTPVTVAICPRTTDPINLGGIIRLATAFSVDAVIVGPGSTDPFSRRVLRVSMGNGLRLPILESQNLLRDLDYLQHDLQIELAGLTTNPAATPIDQAERPTRLGILFGHEGWGLDHETIGRCSHEWTIPMAGGTDSLNVTTAAAIVLYELNRNRPN